MKTWVAATICAVQRGGYLVEINDQNEQNAVYNAIISGAGVSSTYTTVADGGGVAYVWIGGTDKFSEGTWNWDGNNDGTGINFWNGQGNAGTGGGSAVSGMFINWGGKSTGTPNEPDNYNNNQNGAAIGLAGWPSGSGALGIAGEWNDIALSNTLYYVIEYNSTGINENNINKTDIIIYPNPATTTLNVEANLQEQSLNSITLYNLLGSEVYNKSFNKTNKTNLNLGDITSGIYFINIELDNGILYKRKILIE